MVGRPIAYLLAVAAWPRRERNRWVYCARSVHTPCPTPPRYPGGCTCRRRHCTSTTVPWGTSVASLPPLPHGRSMQRRGWGPAAWVPAMAGKGKAPGRREREGGGVVVVRGATHYSCVGGTVVGHFIGTGAGEGSMLRSYHHESTRSHQNSEVKRGWAGLVLG